MLPDTLPEMIKSRVSANGSSLLAQRRDGRSWKQITWKDFETDARSVAAFLADGGFKAGDRAFFECCGGYEGLVSETAVLMLGGVAASAFPFYEGAAASAKTVFAASPQSAARFVSGGAAKAVFFSGAGAKPDGAVAAFRAALKFGFLKNRKLADELDAMFSSVRADSPAVEVSNGSGGPQTFSHGGFMRSLGSALSRAVLSGESQVFCHLPQTSVFSRAARFLPLCASARLAVAQSEEDFFRDILEVMPTAVFLDSGGLENAARRADGKPAFGGRLERIFTDAAPDGETAEFYSRHAIEVSEITFRAV